MSTFEPEVFLAIVHRMSRNLALVMTVLMPVALLSIVPVLFISVNDRATTLYLTVTGFGLFTGALLVTTRVEVPISRLAAGSDLHDWQQRRKHQLGRSARIRRGFGAGTAPFSCRGR